MRKFFLILFCIIPANVFSFYNWLTFSVRTSKEGQKPDFEIAIGGEFKNQEWMYLYERENDSYYKGADLKFHYEGRPNFRFQYYLKEARNIEFTDAVWNIGKKVRIGGAIHTDIITGVTKILSNIELKLEGFEAIYERGLDYYLFSSILKKPLAENIDILCIYKDVNKRKFYQAKIRIRFGKKEQ